MSDLIFVTGATGKIGRHVCAHALQRGLRVRALTRDTARATDLADAGAEIVEGAPGDSDLAAKMAGADAAYVMVPLSPAAIDVGRATHDAVEEAGIGRAVRLSVISSIAESDTALGRVHTELDRDFTARPFRSSVIRPHSFMENFLGAAHTIREGRLVGANGDGRTPYIAASDVALCAVALVASHSACVGAHDLTGPETLNGEEVARVLSSEIGHEVGWMNLEADAHEQMLRGAGMPDFYVELVTDLARLAREGAGAAPTRGFERLVGRRPEDFSAWVRRHRAEFTERAA
jgi:uncharacterized protein YbjT (DUF2867 family)